MTGELLRARKVKERHERRLLAMDGVHGVALGERGGRPLIKVYVEHNGPGFRDSIPATIDDVPVEVEETGAFEAY